MGGRRRTTQARPASRTLGWNVAGTIVVVAAAIAARSVALIGFGIDSLIEIFASMVVVWQLRDAGGKVRVAACRRPFGGS